MQRRIGWKHCFEVLLILLINVLSIIGSVLWMKNTTYSYEITINRMFDIGYFGSLYLMTLGVFFVRAFKNNIKVKSKIIQILIKDLMVFCYLYLIILKLIQGTHLVLPAAEELFYNIGFGDEMVFTMGFLIDCYFLFFCLAEVLFKEKLLCYWNLGMASVYSVLLIFNYLSGLTISYIAFEFLSIILWHILFSYISHSDFENEIIDLKENACEGDINDEKEM